MESYHAATSDSGSAASDADAGPSKLRWLRSATILQHGRSCPTFLRRHHITIDVKTVEDARDWLVDRFASRKHHYVVVVAFPSDSTALPPRAFVVASETLRKFISQRKLTSVPLDTLSRELAALEAWQLITAEQAA